MENRGEDYVNGSLTVSDGTRCQEEAGTQKYIK